MGEGPQRLWAKGHSVYARRATALWTREWQRTFGVDNNSVFTVDDACHKPIDRCYPSGHRIRLSPFDHKAFVTPYGSTNVRKWTFALSKVKIVTIYLWRIQILIDFTL